MFHIVYYRILSSLREKIAVFWVLFFPIILGTCFNAAFSGIYDAEMEFETIPVAVVLEDDSFLKPVLDALSKESDDEKPLLDVLYVSKEEGEKLLKNKKVSGIIDENNNNVDLTVSENGMDSTILQSVLDEYLQTMDLVMAGADITEVMKDGSYIQSKSVSDAELNPYMEYFYALISMACMFASFFGLNCAKEMRADLSSLGMRKSLIPTHRLKIIIGDVLGNYIIQCFAVTLFVCYMQFVLKIDFGNNFFYVLLTAYFGSLIGLMIGLFIGSLKGISEGVRTGISITTSLLLSFLSGLMVGDIRWKIEAAAPILNRLNPATVIADALYSLSIYDTYTRFYSNIGILAVMSVILCIASYLMVRRQDYASL